MSKTLVWFTVRLRALYVKHCTHTFKGCNDKTMTKRPPPAAPKKSVTLYLILWVRLLFDLKFALEPCMWNFTHTHTHTHTHCCNFVFIQNAPLLLQIRGTNLLRWGWWRLSVCLVCLSSQMSIARKLRNFQLKENYGSNVLKPSTEAFSTLSLTSGPPMRLFPTFTVFQKFVLNSWL